MTTEVEPFLVFVEMNQDILPGHILAKHLIVDIKVARVIYRARVADSQRPIVNRSLQRFPDTAPTAVSSLKFPERCL